MITDKKTLTLVRLCRVSTRGGSSNDNAWGTGAFVGVAIAGLKAKGLTLGLSI